MSRLRILENDNYSGPTGFKCVEWYMRNHNTAHKHTWETFVTANSQWKRIGGIHMNCIFKTPHEPVLRTYHTQRMMPVDGENRVKMYSVPNRMSEEENLYPIVRIITKIELFVACRMSCHLSEHAQRSACSWVSTSQVWSTGGNIVAGCHYNMTASVADRCLDGVKLVGLPTPWFSS